MLCTNGNATKWNETLQESLMPGLSDCATAAKRHRGGRLKNWKKYSKRERLRTGMQKDECARRGKEVREIRVIYRPCCS